MNSLSIRIASQDDLNDILFLENQTETERYSKDVLLASLNNDTYLNIVAFNNDICVGYLTSNIVLDECSLLKIIVDKNYRKKGVGGELISFLESQLKAKGVTNILLEVREDNVGAISLYEKCCFVKQGIRKNYYNDCDALLYGKCIK